jgi:hypothetical protein
MADIRDRVRSDRNWLESLLHCIPGFRGYLGKEERRESDKLQREYLAGQLQSTKSALDELALALSNTGKLEQLGGLDRLRSKLDKVVRRLKHAAYGYTGFFDAVKIREDELDRVYEFDATLLGHVQSTVAAMQRLPSLAGADQLAAELQSVQEQLKGLDAKLDERDQLLKGMK